MSVSLRFVARRTSQGLGGLRRDVDFSYSEGISQLQMARYLSGSRQCTVVWLSDPQSGVLGCQASGDRSLKHNLGVWQA